MFDFLYAVEYVILLTFGLSTNIPDLGNIWNFIIIIIVLAFISVLLRLIYYLGLHVWSNVIISDRKLVKKELQEESQDMIQRRFLKYVFVQRNSWILGKLKHIHITLIVLPKEFTESIGKVELIFLQYLKLYYVFLDFFFTIFSHFLHFFF